MKSDEYKGIRNSSDIYEKGGSKSSLTQDVRSSVPETTEPVLIDISTER